MSFRHTQDNRCTKPTQNAVVRMHVSPHLQTPSNDSSGTLLACLCMQSKQTRTNSTGALLKPSHYFLLWNRAGFLRMLPACNPLGGNHNGKQAAGYGNRVLSAQHYIIRHNTWHTSLQSTQLRPEVQELAR